MALRWQLVWDVRRVQVTISCGMARCRTPVWDGDSSTGHFLWDGKKLVGICYTGDILNLANELANPTQS
jgi:hypothetical protein